MGEDEESTDLGALEKRLTEKNQQSRHGSLATGSAPTSPSQPASAGDGAMSSPQSGVTSPEAGKEKEKDKDKEKKEKDEKRKSFTPSNDQEDESEEEVAALSEMMCSLVTNQSGETRYLGRSLILLQSDSELILA